VRSGLADSNSESGLEELKLRAKHWVALIMRTENSMMLSVKGLARTTSGSTDLATLLADGEEVVALVHDPITHCYSRTLRRCTNCWLPSAPVRVMSTIVVLTRVFAKPARHARC
jgi:hypothetical protein